MPLDALPTELLPLTTEQQELVALCREFAAREIRPRARAVDEADTEVPMDVWRSAARAGLTSFMLPAELGGGGATDVLTQCLVQEELCAGDVGIGNLLTSGGFFAGPILELGTAEQARHWIPPIAVDDDPPLTAVAVTEPGHGSDAAGIEATATRVGEGYVLRGEKAWISNAGAAEYYVVFATTAPGQRSRGVSAFVLDRSTPGVSFSAPMRKLGQRAIVSASIYLDGAVVGADHRLGPEGGAFGGLMRTFQTSRVVLGAAATGLARAAAEYALGYAGNREQFGKPIAEHQAVAFRLADMATRVESSRLLVWRAARRLDAGLDAARESSMAKLVASETAMWVTWAAVQVLGGWGYSREHLVEKWMRDAKLEEIEEGTSDIQRLVISRTLTRPAGR